MPKSLEENLEAILSKLGPAFRSGLESYDYNSYSRQNPVNIVVRIRTFFEQLELKFSHLKLITQQIQLVGAERKNLKKALEVIKTFEFEIFDIAAFQSLSRSQLRTISEIANLERRGEREFFDHSILKQKKLDLPQKEFDAFWDGFTAEATEQEVNINFVVKQQSLAIEEPSKMNDDPNFEKTEKGILISKLACLGPLKIIFQKELKLLPSKNDLDLELKKVLNTILKIGDKPILLLQDLQSWKEKKSKDSPFKIPVYELKAEVSKLFCQICTPAWLPCTYSDDGKSALDKKMKRLIEKMQKKFVNFSNF